VFGRAIRQAHPSLEARVGKPLENWISTRRGSETKGDIILDAQFVVNTPVTKMSSVRPAHVDSEDEICAGLLYMRESGDMTEGGNLDIYKFRHAPAFGGHYAPLSDVTVEDSVGYAANGLQASSDQPPLGGPGGMLVQ
jgi:hypothetical protein